MDAAAALLLGVDEEGAPVRVGASPVAAATGRARPSPVRRHICCLALTLLALTLLGAGVFAALCYRGPLRMDFDPESDVTVVSGLVISAPVVGGAASRGVAMRLRMKAFVLNPNNWVDATLTDLRATVSYLDAMDKRPLFMGTGIARGPWVVPGGLTAGRRNSIFAQVELGVNTRDPALVQALAQACFNATGRGGLPEVRPRFQAVVELTARYSLLVARLPISVVEVADLECPPLPPPPRLLDTRPASFAEVEERGVGVGVGQERRGRDRWPV